MSSFASKRTEMIKKKNDFIIKSMQVNESIEFLDSKCIDVEEGISRIPKDLPEELQDSVDVAVENVRHQLREEKQLLEKQAYEVIVEGDSFIDESRKMSHDLQEQSEKLSDISCVPLIGKFAEHKSEELLDQSEQMADLAQEAIEFQDKLALQRNKLF